MLALLNNLLKQTFSTVQAEITASNFQILKVDDDLLGSFFGLNLTEPDNQDLLNYFKLISTLPPLEHFYLIAISFENQDRLML